MIRNNVQVAEKDETPSQDASARFVERLQEDFPPFTSPAEKSRPIKSADDFWKRLGL